jgi:hypothetical protein
MSPLVFISHKHADHSIATAIRSFINEQSRGTLRVFQSSDATAVGPKIARELNPELQKALWEAKIVILVYTTTDKDWGYCMWECGVATTPGSPDTRIIVFQCADHVPNIYSGQVRVDARTRAGIAPFVTQFMTDPDFFPGSAGPLTGFHAASNEVASAIAKFHSDLAAVLPKGEASEWRAHPFVQIEISSMAANSIKELPPDKRVIGGRTLIEKEAFILGGDAASHRLFGLANFEQGLTLGALISHWKNSRPAAPAAWIDALVEQIVKCARYEFPALHWTHMHPVPEDIGTHAPVVSRVGRLPSGAMQFDIHFYPFTLMTATPVSARMVKRSEMFCKYLKPGDENKIKVLDLLRELDSTGINRIPFLDHTGKALYLTHRSLLDRFMSRRLAKGSVAKLEEVTLADMFGEQPSFKTVISTSFGFVPFASTLAQVRTEMAKLPDCRDIFVTRSGAADEPVEGFITDVMIATADSY